MNTLTEMAAMLAHILASTFGHEWTGAVSPQGIKSLAIMGHLSVATIYEIVDAKAEGDKTPYWMRGIQAPTLSPEGDVVHTTGSGRLTWAITPEGDTTLTISRPGGIPCLVAHVSSWGDWRVERGSAPSEMRHAEALAFALRPLIDAFPEGVRLPYAEEFERAGWIHGGNAPMLPVLPFPRKQIGGMSWEMAQY